MATSYRPASKKLFSLHRLRAPECCPTFCRPSLKNCAASMPINFSLFNLGLLFQINCEPSGVHGFNFIKIIPKYIFNLKKTELDAA
ncbi:hypothetical protein M7784_07505 [Desulfovibrio aminophilus]|nr:hypothetical protein [Desulfovibrio aminophilus]MCM0755093.1 hypothetical protein [Desulfovibrio aminophilus]